MRVTGSSGNPSVLRGDLYSGFAGFLIYDSRNCVQMIYKGIKESVPTEFGVDFFFLSQCHCLILYQFERSQKMPFQLMSTRVAI